MMDYRSILRCGRIICQITLRLLFAYGRRSVLSLSKNDGGCRTVGGRPFLIVPVLGLFFILGAAVGT